MNSPFIVPIHVGDMTWDHSESMYRKGMGTKEKMCFSCFYIGGTDMPIMIDSGLPSQERARQYHPYTNPTISPDQVTEVALRNKGIDPESIKLVIHTHMHWDHVGNPKLFPNADIMVSDAELHYALDPLPIHYPAYESFKLGIVPTWLKAMDQYKIIKMEEREVATGVRIFPSPGHSVGGLSIYVETADGPYVIPGDNIMIYEALKPEPETKMPFFTPGFFTDYVELWHSIEKSLEYVDGDTRRILPGHEKLIYRQERYPLK
jgi:N-acyl homoserine lactone hydrolase